MSKIYRAATLTVLGVLGAMASANTTVPAGTDVKLKFAQSVDSRKAHQGDRVKFTVAENVMVGGKTILMAGMPVTGVIENVTHRDHFGKNASIRLVIDPIRAKGGTLYVQPRDKQSVTGRRSDTAAAASGAGAVVLGPIGLIGGYFVKGKPVKVQVGDPLVTSVSRTVTLKI